MAVAPFFQSVELPSVRRNLFDKTFENKLSCNMGFLVPLLCEECVPGDKYRIRPEIFARMAPMIAPIMHRVDIYTHTYFVPMRLVWSDFENYVSGDTTGSVTPVKPFFNVQNLVKNEIHLTFCKTSTLWDYLGLPALPSVPSQSYSTVVEEKICSLPFRAYQLIFNEFYRDKNLYGDAAWKIPTSSGEESLVDTAELLALRRRAWQKDYFTSALPWAQRGPEVSIGLSGSAEVKMKTPINPQQLIDANTGQPVSSTYDGQSPTLVTYQDGTNNLQFTSGSDVAPVALDLNNKLYADLSTATAVTINALRRASSVQKFLERSAVGGSRLIESNFAHFGVRGKDSTLQRPEYLGGSMQTLSISSVLETYANPSGATIHSGLLGSMAGNGISSSVNRAITKYCDEQGYIITLLSILPKASYQQGLPRMFSKFDRLDEYFPEFSHLGEQAIKKKELFFSVTSDSYNNSDFGYQSRFSDMKYRADEVHGDFQSSMDFWHMGRKFAGNGASYESTTKPVLNKDFVECHPTHRIFNTTLTNYDKIYVDCLLKIKALRPMPIFGTPSF